jgi:hypothetical protein
MMTSDFRIIGDLSGVSLRLLLSIATQRCDELLVTLTGMDLAPSAQSALDRLWPARIACQETSEYPGGILPWGSVTVCRYGLSTDVVKVLATAAPTLLSWQEPELPNDPCLLSKGEPWLTTIASDGIIARGQNDDPAYGLCPVLSGADLAAMHVASADQANLEADGVGEKPSRWSKRVEWFDWLILGAALVLALITLWVGSSIVRGAYDYLPVGMLWVGVGVAWCASVLQRTTDRVYQLAVLAVLVGSFVSIVFWPAIAVTLWDASNWIAAGLLVAMGVLVLVPIGLFLVRQRPIRLVWFVAPTIVLATAALVLTGGPRTVRFAVAEAELTSYAQGVADGASSTYFDEPISVGGVPVFEVIREDGQVLLVTGYIGILGDDPAGIAYVPDGAPVGVGWQHIRGPWFSWVPLGYVYSGTD